MTVLRRKVATYNLLTVDHGNQGINAESMRWPRLVGCIRVALTAIAARLGRLGRAYLGRHVRILRGLDFYRRYGVNRLFDTILRRIEVFIRAIDLSQQLSNKTIAEISGGKDGDTNCGQE